MKNKYRGVEERGDGQKGKYDQERKEETSKMRDKKG